MSICHGTRNGFVRASAAAALALVSGLTGPAAAQSPSFQLIGHIEDLSLTSPGDPLSAATMTVRNIKVTLPRNLLITMPGGYLTAEKLFHGPDGAPQPSSGLALRDPAPPRVPLEAEIIGNITDGMYVAGVVHVSQGALHSGAGFIQAIALATGELRIGAKNGNDGARIRLNDPTGVYGVANADKPDVPLDKRFALDPDNSPVHAKTGYPVCVPRSAADAKCPESNRPTGASSLRFTCARGSDPAAVPNAPAHPCDPSLPVPLRVGDYVTYVGMLQETTDGGFLIAAHGLDAELGIYTSPNTEPVYLFVEEALQGTKGETFPGIPQEETTRFRVVGFTTDPSRNVEVRLVDGGRNEVGTSFTGPAGLPPSNGPQLGRFRNTWPAKDDARAVRRDVLVSVVGSPNGKLANGLTSGRYTAPVGEYIFPEPTSFGVRGFPLPVSFENFCFLTAGGGIVETLSGPVSPGPLVPFPNSGHAQSQLIGTGTARACDGQ